LDLVEAGAREEAAVGVDVGKCINCGKCAEVCHYNAIAVIKDKVLFFPELCHVCGACKIVCPTDVVIEKNRKIGVLKHGKSKNIEFHYALLETAEGGMSPRLVKRVKEYAKCDINLFDSPPGTACPVIASITGANYALIVTEPTVSGIHDMKRILDVTRHFGVKSGVVVNKYDLNTEMTQKIKEETVRYNAAFVGTIPYDKIVTETQMNKLSVVEYKDCAVSAKIKEVWETINHR